tara:strand:+ start:444 stop:1043 length:600 start_codon:yes stop_codon:yes gene_type:complete
MLPLDLKIVILQFLEPKKINNYFLDELYRNLEERKKLLRIMKLIIDKNDKEYIKLYESKIYKLKRIIYFMNKYNVYQKDYEEYLKLEQNRDVINKGPPILYDAIISGCSYPFCKSSQRRCDLKDIREIIKLCPESVLYDEGVARCRNNVTPLWAAYNNDNELLSNKNRKEIITLLLNNGATNEDTILLNCERVKIIDDI